MTVDADRRILVIASQCSAHGRLGFLPTAAKRFYTAMTDPAVGGCRPALSDASALLIDPRGSQAQDAFRAALREAAGDGARLFVSLIGHGFFDGNSFYFLLPDSWTDRGLEPGKALKPIDIALEEQATQASGLDGLLLLVDACYAGEAAQAGSERLAQLRAGTWRFEILTASDNREAAGGCFTKTLTRILKEGVDDRLEPTLRCARIRTRLEQECPLQRPIHATWNADDALFLAVNVALSGHDAPWAHTESAGEIDRLTDSFQLVPALGEIVTAIDEHPEGLTILAPGGRGKSTLVAALARPDVSGGVVPDRFLSAVAFLNESTTPESLAGLLASQLGKRLDGLATAAAVVQGLLPAEEWDALTALDRQVVRPLIGLSSTLAYGEVLRIAVDGLDRMSDVAQPINDDLVRLGALDCVRLITSARPGAWVPPDAHVMPLERPQQSELAGYIKESGREPELADVAASPGWGDWLAARLLSEAARQFLPEAVSTLRQLLSEKTLYDAVISGILDREGVTWDAFRPLFAPFVAAGSGPLLPIRLVDEACAALGGPAEASGVHHLVTAAGALIVRSQPGTPSERVGLFHQTLNERLQSPDSQYTVDVDAGHRGVLEAIARIAPAGGVWSDDPAQRYAEAAEPEHLWALGRYAEATASRRQRKFHTPRENLEAWKRWLTRAETTLAPEDPVVLAARHGVAYWTGEAGEPVAGRDMCKNVLADFDEGLGPEHRETLTVRRNIVRFTDLAGDPDEARNLAIAVLEDRTRILGASDRETLVSRLDLADITGACGDVAGAVRALTALIPEIERTLGADDPHTLDARASVGYYLIEQEKHDVALLTYTALVDDCRRVYGERHPDTIRARMQIALCTGEGGDPAEALRLYREIKTDCFDMLGPNHPDAFNLRSNIAYYAGVTGDRVEAHRGYAELAADSAHILGSDHPDTIRYRESEQRYAD